MEKDEREKKRKEEEKKDEREKKRKEEESIMRSRVLWEVEYYEKRVVLEKKKENTWMKRWRSPIFQLRTSTIFTVL